MNIPPHSQLTEGLVMHCLNEDIPLKLRPTICLNQTYSLLVECLNCAQTYSIIPGSVSCVSISETHSSDPQCSIGHLAFLLETITMENDIYYNTVSLLGMFRKKGTANSPYVLFTLFSVIVLSWSLSIDWIFYQKVISHFL